MLAGKVAQRHSANCFNDMLQCDEIQATIAKSFTWFKTAFHVGDVLDTCIGIGCGLGVGRVVSRQTRGVRH